MNIETKVKLNMSRIARNGLLILMSLVLSVLGGTATLNYTGFCFDQGRYLTDEERIRPIIQAVLDTYPRITYAYDKLPISGYEVITDESRCCGQGDMSRYDKSHGGTPIDAKQLVPYRDIDDFLTTNPDCCSFTRIGLYGELGDIDSLWPKITGYSAGFVNVKFRVRYRDTQGNIQTKFSAFSSHQANCGAANPPL
jgi:hypothetical protein